MTRLLKTSGFAGLAVMMIVGLYQSYLAASGSVVPAWMIGGHAHLGVLSILAVVLGFAVPALGVTETLRTVVSWTFVVGQWALPLTVWIAAGFGIGILHLTVFLWGGLLVLSMAIMTWQAAARPESDLGDPRGPGPAPADD